MFTKAMSVLFLVVFVLIWAGTDAGPGVAAAVAAWCAGVPWLIVDWLDPETA